MRLRVGVEIPIGVNSRLYQFLTLEAEKNEIGIDLEGPARGLALLKWITQSIAPRRYSLAYLFTATEHYHNHQRPLLALTAPYFKI